MAFIYDLTDTWNNAGTSFNGIKLNITDTASSVGSKLIDVQIGGVSKFTVGKTGTITATGIVESTSGGFKFPDGTTQTTASVGAGGTVTSVTGAGTVSGLTLTGNITTSGSLTLGGTLSLTSGNVTSALGYTPYNDTNPAGYITSSALSPYLTSATAATTYQPLDGDLTAIAALAGTVGLIRKTAANTYSLDTDTYLTGITSEQVTTALGYTPYNATNPSGYLSTVSLTANVTGTLPIANGGTGATTAAGALTSLGAYPAANPNGYTSNTGTVTSVNLTAGTGVSVSGGPITSSGSITVTNTAPDQVVSLTAGTNVTVTGTYPNFTIAASGGGETGTVTSVAASGGTTGLTFTGSPITTAGTLTLGGTLAVANGGTGATTLTSGYVLKGNGTSAVSASVLYDDDTNIGIGTTSPSALLHISQNGGGDIGALVSQTNGGNGTTARYRATHGSGTAFNLQAGNGHVDLKVTSNHHLTFGTNDTERFRIGASGQFGIGGATYGSAGQVLTSGGASAAPTWTTPTTGTVTSVGGTGTVSGLTLTGTVTTSGNLTLGGTLSGIDLSTQVTGTLPIANGGTGATTDSGARTALGLGTAAVLNSGVANGVATLDGSGTVPTSQLPGAVLGGLNYQGTWNASTNTPTLASSTGSKGYYYVVSVAGSTNLNGTTDWKIGDWAVYDGSTWQKVDNTDAVSSVNGLTGSVVLTTSDVAQGTNLYFTEAAARGSVSAGTGISYNSTSGVITNSAPDQTVALTGAGTTTVTGTYPNFTITSNDSATGTVTSVGGTGTVNGLTLTGTVTTSGSLTLGGTLSDVSLTSQVTGTLPIANGGTGATTTANALTALGAYPAANPSGYTNNTGTVTSVGGTGTVSGITLTGSVTSSGSLTLGGTLSLTSSDVTTALGYTPSDNSNQDWGLITGSLDSYDDFGGLF
jgi:hypothetical protein